MQAYNPSTLVTQPSVTSMVWTADRVRGFAFWFPLLIVGLAFLTQHNLLYAAGDSIDYDQVSDLVAEAGSSSMLREFSFLAISMLGVVLLLKPARDRSEMNSRLLVGCLLMCTLMSASCIWAEDSFQSFKRSLVPALMLIAALGITKHWRARELLMFTAITSASFLLLGIAAECAQGTFSISGAHRFAGTQHPNTQGINCAILSLASLALYLESRQSRVGRGRLFWLLLAVIGMGFLLLTRSRTATVAFGAALAVFTLQGATPAKKLLCCGVLLQLAAILGVLWYASDSQDGFLSAVKMGREQDTADITTLTGRIPIWGAVLGAVSERPLLGYGYGGFWTPRRVEQFSSMFDWTFMHSHSAYLETLLNVGIAGLLLGLIVVIGTLVSASRSFRISGDQGYHFISALLVFAMVHGFLDGSFARDGFETFVAALAISMVVFHSAKSVVKTGSNPSAPLAWGSESKASGSMHPGARYRTDLTTVSG